MTPHGFAAEFEPVCVVDEAIQDGISVCWIADQVEPARHGKLAGHHRGAAAVTVLEDFEEVVASIAVERLEAPVIEDEDVHPGKALHARGDAAIALGEREVIDQPRQPCIENRAIVAAGLVADGAGEPTLADPCGTDDGAVLMSGDPVALEQHVEQAPIEAARGAVIDILGHGMVAQLGMTQAKGQTPVVAPGRFVIEQQGQPFGMAETGGIAVALQFGERMGHTGQAELVELLKCRVFQHSWSFQL